MSRESRRAARPPTNSKPGSQATGFRVLLLAGRSGLIFFGVDFYHLQRAQYQDEQNHRGRDRKNSDAQEQQPQIPHLRRHCPAGLKRITLDPVGQPFNPEHHQAMVMQEVQGVEPNTVVTVFQKGYLLNGRLLRPAMVVVAKAAEKPLEN